MPSAYTARGRPFHAHRLGQDGSFSLLTSALEESGNQALAADPRKEIARTNFLVPRSPEGQRAGVAVINEQIL
jgi:hypothetical protein